MKEDRRAISDSGKLFTVNFKCNCVNKNRFIFRNANETPGITENNIVVFLITPYCIYYLVYQKYFEIILRPRLSSKKTAFLMPPFYTAKLWKKFTLLVLCTSTNAVLS